MKRDWQIIKELLFKFRDDTIKDYLKEVMFGPIERTDLILEHINLMLEDNLISGIKVLPSFEGYGYVEIHPRLTSLGQTVAEFLINNSLESIIFQAKNANLPVSIEMIKSRIGI